MRRTFAHHFSGQLKIDENHIINLGPFYASPCGAKVPGAFAPQLSLSKSRLVSKKPRRLGNCSHKTTGEIAAIKPRGKLQPWSNVASVFLRIWSALTGVYLAVFKQSIEISGAENVTSIMSGSAASQSGRSAPTGLSWRAREKGPPTVQLTMNL